MSSRLSAPAPKLSSAPKSADPFYRSAQWRGLVEDRKLDSDYFAARKRAKRGERMILDHKVELKDGGAALDPGNTEWLTFGEHQAKTARKRAERAAGPIA
jgi:5-methylcytosine-specific restriction protein A